MTRYAAHSDPNRCKAALLEQMMQPVGFQVGSGASGLTLPDPTNILHAARTRVMIALSLLKLLHVRTAVASVSLLSNYRACDTAISYQWQQDTSPSHMWEVVRAGSTNF